MLITIIKNEFKILKILYKQLIKINKLFIILKLFFIEILINYHITLIKILSDFKIRFINEYIKNFQ